MSLNLSIPSDMGTGMATQLTLFLITLFLLLLSLKKLKKPNKKQILPLPPGPHGLPILGSLPFLNPNLHHYFTGLARAHGPILSLRLGRKLCVVISSPSLAREILLHQDAAFANRVPPAAALRYYGDTKLDVLWSPYGAHWRMLRRVAVHEMLGPASLDATAALRGREMRRAVDGLWALAKSGAAVDVRETAFLAMLNMMTSMLLGERVGGGRDERKFRRLIEEAIDLLMKPNVADFFPAVAALDPQGLGRRMRKLMAWINRYLDGIVEGKMRRMASGERRGDVLEALLELVQRGDSQPPFTMDDLRKLLVVSLFLMLFNL